MKMTRLLLALLVAQAEPPRELGFGAQPGHHVSAGFAGGLSVMVAVEYAYDWDWFGLYAMGQFQFLWLHIFAVRPPLLGGLEVGPRLHLGRRFSLGIGAFLDPRIIPGFTATPFMVHLGDRGQHTLWGHVTLVPLIVGDTFGASARLPATWTVFPVIGYRYTFF